METKERDQHEIITDARNAIDTGRPVTAIELASMIRCGRSTVYYMLKAGQIPAVSIGKTGVRFDYQAVLKALGR